METKASDGAGAASPSYRRLLGSRRAPHHNCRPSVFEKGDCRGVSCWEPGREGVAVAANCRCSRRYTVLLDFTLGYCLPYGFTSRTVRPSSTTS